MTPHQPRGPEDADTEEQTRALFRSIALERGGYYDSSPGGPPRLSVWQRRIRRIIESILNDRLKHEPALLRLLDAGCGRGDFTLELAARYRGFGEVVGYDFSAEIVDLARAAAAGEPRVRFAVGGLDKIPFEPSHADVTVCVNVLHHIPTERLASALAELARVTGRTLILEIKNASSPYFRMHSHRVEGVAIFPVTVEHVRDLLRPHGFELLARQGIFGFKWLSPLVVLHFQRKR